MQRFLIPVLQLAAVLSMGCPGRLELPEEEWPPFPAMDGSSIPTNCGIAAFKKSCNSTDGACHGPSPDAPGIMGLDLTVAGIVAAHDGADFVGKAPSNDLANGAACSPLSTPPVMGQLLVDPVNPEESLLYSKMASSAPCGAHMPVLPRKGQPPTVSASDQACILTWIKSLPGVCAGGCSGGSGDSGGGGTSDGGDG